MNEFETHHKFDMAGSQPHWLPASSSPAQNGSLQGSPVVQNLPTPQKGDAKGCLSLSTPLLFLLSLSLSPSPSSFSSHCPPLSLLFLLLIIASLRLAEYLKGGGRRVNVCSSKGTHDTLKDDMAVCKGISSLPPPFLSSFSVTPVFSSPHRGDGRGHNSVQAGQSVMS